MDIYIFKQILVSYLLAVLSLMAIIWLTQSLRFLDFITNNGISVFSFISLTSLLMPRIFAVISPIVVFASVLFVYNKMIADRELVVIKAAGISPSSMIKPAVVFGAILMLLNFFVYNYGIGSAEKKFNELEWQIKNNVSGVMLKSGEFNFLQKNLMVFISNQNKDGSVEGILINDEKKENVKKTIFAEFGRLIYNQQKPRIILVNGVSQEFNAKKKDVQTTSFDRYSVDLGAPEAKSKKSNSVRAMSFGNLWGALDNEELTFAEKSEMFAEANKRILSPIYNVLFALIAASSLVMGGFSRRGQAKILLASLGVMVFVQALELAIFSKASDNLNYVFLMYFNLIIPFIATILFVGFYKPAKVKKLVGVLSCFLCFIFCFEAGAKPIAGEVLTSAATDLYVSIEPQKNVADFLSEDSVENKDSDIDFNADEVEYYNDLSTVVAKGNVQIVKDNLTVYADKINYNQKTDTIVADGNVVLVEENGTVVFSDSAELTSKLTKAEMNKVLVVMQDKTRISANRVEKREDKKKVLENATYSPCDVCEGKDPLWQLKANKITHDEASQDIYYKHARLEFGGVPVFYTPYFSHPDPMVKRRSGFLVPSFESDSYLGFNIGMKYFWAIDDNQDFLFSPIISSDKGVVWGGDYKKYSLNGYFELGGSYLRDDDLDSNRGELRSNIRHEINDIWVFDADINYVSDRTYLKDLNLPDEDDPWLTSEVKFEGFDNRNYSYLGAYYYKTLSYELRNSNQPFITPLFDYENYGDVGAYGAYSKTQFSAASINRDDGDTSTQRFTMINSWTLPYVSSLGEKYKMQASVKSDLYYVSNYFNQYNEDYTGTVARVFPQLGMEWSLPFVKSKAGTKYILEPVVVGVLASNGGQKSQEIPNEDSLDIRIDDTNILSLDRYSGYDRNDVGSRVSYGLNWSAYGDDFGRTTMFLAQSYNFNESDEFDQIDGGEKFSDYVGRVYAAPYDFLDFDLRFRLDKDDLAIKYSELGTTLGPDMLKLYVSYIYLDGELNVNDVLYNYDDRRELYTSLNVKLSKNWSALVYNRQDLSTGADSSLERGGEIIYDNECITLTGYVNKEDSIDPSLENDFEFGINFLLKTLGGAGQK